MTTFRQFKSVFITIFKNSLKKTKGLGEKKSHKIVSMVAISIGLLMLMAYVVLFTTIITKSAIAENMQEKVLYTFIAMSQMGVLFLGAFASMSYIFFSKDNQLLASLPIEPRAIFLAKFSMAYVAEFFIGSMLILPTVTTYGIVCILSGIPINAGFFIFQVFGLFIFPIIPLLFISLVSIPLMYLVAFIRRRTLSNAIAIAIIILIVMSLYFGLIGSFSNMSQEMEEGVVALTPQFKSLLHNVYRATIFNKPYIDAMLGKNVAINVFVYLAGIIVLMLINVVLSSFFYKKGISVIIEGDGTRDSGKSKKELVYTSTGLKYSLLKKEIKTLANTPMMLVNSLMGVLLGPVIVIFMTKTGGLTMGNTDPRAELYAIGFVSYIVAIMVGATNQVAMVGFSREGKNLFTLKSLPLSADMLVKVKLFVATIMNILTVVIVAIVYIAITPNHSVLSAIGIAVVTLSCGFGVNCLGLYNDLKNPNLTWTNATELTKNNKKAIKPLLTIIGIGLSYMIMGMVLSMQTAISLLWSYVIFFAVSFMANAILIILGYKKLFDNPKEMLERVEG